MANLLNNLIENYVKENEQTDLIEILKSIKNLESNPSNILNIEINEDIIKLLFEKNIDTTINNLKFIKRIFLAEQNGIHFDLSKEQEDLLKRFSELANNKIIEIDNSKEIEEYKKLLEKIKEEKIIITEIEAISTLFEQMNITFEEKNKILIEILNYNKNIISKNNEYVLEENSEEVIVEETKLSKEGLKQLFEKHAYDLKLVSESDIQTIIDNSSYEKVDAILEALKEPKLSFISEHSRLFVSILAYSNIDVLKNLLKISQDKKFDLEDLKNIASIFIPKAKKRLKKNTKTSNEIIIRGYENFIDMLEVLENNNFDIQTMVQKFSNIFRISAKIVRKNIKAFNLYRFQLTESRRNKGLSSYAWLSAMNLMEVCDNFIELGLERYVKKYTSKLMLPKDDLSFYRIYYAQKTNKPYYKVTENTGDMFYLIGEVWGITPAYGITSIEDAKKLCGNVTMEINEELENVLNNDDNNRIDDLVFKNDILKQLEIYKKDIMTYDFNGKLISRFKVLRLANTLLKNGIVLTKDNLLYLITRNSILSKEQLEVIDDLVSSLDYGKEK